MIKTWNDGSKFPSLDGFIYQRISSESEIPPVREIDEFLELHRCNRPIGLLGELYKFVCYGCGRVGQKASCELASLSATNCSTFDFCSPVSIPRMHRIDIPSPRQLDSAQLPAKSWE